MRILLALPLLLGPTPGLADACDDLVEKVATAARASVASRSQDFANFTTASETTLTLSCGGAFASAVGAQYRGDTPPAEYYATFADAGAAVTGISAGILRDAAERAQADAKRLRHSNVPAGGVLVTCSFSQSDKGALTMCAVIERDNRS